MFRFTCVNKGLDFVSGRQFTGFCWDLQGHHSANYQTLHWTEHIALGDWALWTPDSLNRFQWWFGNVKNKWNTQPGALIQRDWIPVLLMGSLGGEPKVHGHFAPCLARLNMRQEKSLHLRQSRKLCGVMVARANISCHNLWRVQRLFDQQWRMSLHEEHWQRLNWLDLLVLSLCAQTSFPVPKWHYPTHAAAHSRY